MQSNCDRDLLLYWANVLLALITKCAVGEAPSTTCLKINQRSKVRESCASCSFTTTEKIYIIKEYKNKNRKSPRFTDPTKQHCTCTCSRCNIPDHRIRHRRRVRCGTSRRRMFRLRTVPRARTGFRTQRRTNLRRRGGIESTLTAVCC